MGTQPGAGLTGAGKVVVTILVVGMLGTAGFLMRDKIFPKGKTEKAGDVDVSKFQELASGRDQVEAVDPTGITLQTEYAYIPNEKLPPVEGASAYKWNADDPTVVFPINVWIGWLPIVAANHGFDANEESVFYKEFGFKVQLSLIDDPITARNTYVAGDSHILWGTLDMMALFAPELMKDSRTAPRIFQQIDWSSGGDGIVVRDHIKSVADLKGKTIVYAPNSPSEYYVTALLLFEGIKPSEVSTKPVATAFEATPAFLSDPNVDAAVSWAPDIYNIPEKVPGTLLLSSTADASKIITDVWAARADFAKDHPEIIEGLVEGVFKAMEKLENDPSFQKQACEWMGKGYGMPADEIEGMLLDAHSTNFAENKQFFLNAKNPTNFENTWNLINYTYGSLGKIDNPVPFDQVMDFSIIKKLDDAGKFSQQVDTYSAVFNPSDWEQAAEAPLVRNVVRIHFYPNSANLHELARDEYGKKIEGQFYDPSVDEALERAGVMAGQFDRAVILITGHCDASLKGTVPEELVVELSKDRAEAVKQALIDKYNLDPDKFRAEGKGWNEPFNPKDPSNHALNRRVEVKVYPLEGE